MKDKKILIREANKSDCRDILKWRNDKISRKMSLDKNIILYKTHKAWFFSVLEDIYRTHNFERRKDSNRGDDPYFSKSKKVNELINC